MSQTQAKTKDEIILDMQEQVKTLMANIAKIEKAKLEDHSVLQGYPNIGITTITHHQ